MRVMLLILFLTGETPTVEQRWFANMEDCSAIGLARVKVLQKRPEVQVMFAECGVSKLHMISN